MKEYLNAFIEVEWQGAQNEPRIELLEGPFVHSCQTSEKRPRGMFTWVFIPEGMSGK